MSGRAKGRLAVLGLVLLLLAFGFALASTPAARVRFWAWRARSSSREVRLAARERLAEIGRPAIDGVFAELVAGEAVDRLADGPARKRLVLVGQFIDEPANPNPGKRFFDGAYVVDPTLSPHHPKLVFIHEAGPQPDPLAWRLASMPRGSHRTLVAGYDVDEPMAITSVLLVPLDDDDGLALRVVQETQARLELER